MRKKVDVQIVFMVAVSAATFSYIFHTELAEMIAFLWVNLWQPYSNYILIGMMIAIIAPFARLLITIRLDDRKYRRLRDEDRYGVFKSAYLMLKREEKR